MIEAPVKLFVDRKSGGYQTVPKDAVFTQLAGAELAGNLGPL